MPKTPLAHYKKLAKEYGPKLGLKQKVRVAVDSWAHFDFDEDGTFVIYGKEPLAPREDAVFIHYLGHSKLLEEGIPLLSVAFDLNKSYIMKWNRMNEKEFDEICIKNYRNTFSYVCNRSADQFQDFFVWRFLSEKLGEEGRKLFRTYMDWFVQNAKPKNLYWLFDVDRKELGTNFFPYVDFIDYFVSFWLLTKLLGFDKEHRLIQSRYKAVLKHPEFSKYFPKTAEQNVKDLRAFFLKIDKDYPQVFDIASGGDIEQIYKDYYWLYWEHLGVHPNKLNFVNHDK